MMIPENPAVHLRPGRFPSEIGSRGFNPTLDEHWINTQV